MKLPTLREIGTEARLLLIGIPVLIWTLIPIYHMFVFAISPKEDAFSGKVWPTHPTLHNFEIVFRQQHYFLRDFWVQLGNSTVLAASVGMLTLFIATAAAFAISQDLFEAAEVDGANWWQKFRYITWPSMQALYLTCTLLSMIWTLGDFNSVYLLTGGGPADLTHVLSTLGIRYLRLDQLNLAMASIVCAMPLVLPLVYFMMKRLSR